MVKIYQDIVILKATSSLPAEVRWVLINPSSFQWPEDHLRCFSHWGSHCVQISFPKVITRRSSQDAICMVIPPRVLSIQICEDNYHRRIGSFHLTYICPSCTNDEVTRELRWGSIWGFSISGLATWDPDNQRKEVRFPSTGSRFRSLIFFWCRVLGGNANDGNMMECHHCASADLKVSQVQAQEMSST